MQDCRLPPIGHHHGRRILRNRKSGSGRCNAVGDGMNHQRIPACSQGGGDLGVDLARVDKCQGQRLVIERDAGAAQRGRVLGCRGSCQCSEIPAEDRHQATSGYRGSVVRKTYHSATCDDRTDSER